MAATGICLLYMGGPATLDEVAPFLRQLFSDRDLIRLPGGRLLQPAFARLITRLRAPRVRRYYAEIGGGSPLGRITSRQAELLAAALAPHGEFRVEIAMRYSAPRADAAVARLLAAGVTRCLALPLYPQYSGATTGSSFRDLDRAVTAAGARLELTRLEDFHAHPGYLDALSAKVAEGLASLGEPAPAVVFSAHSLPQRMIDEGDPYERQIRATVDGVVRRLGLQRWHLGFQSRSGPVRWLQPEIQQLLDGLIDGGERRLLLVPVSFVSDHIETLHEVDLRMRPACLARGATAFARCPSLNDDPRFIEALARLVLETCQRPPIAQQALPTS